MQENTVVKAMEPGKQQCGTRAKAKAAKKQKGKDQKLRELRAEVARLRQRLDDVYVEYGRVEVEIIRADPFFDGNSNHASPCERLIASIQSLAAAAARAA